MSNCGWMRDWQSRPVPQRSSQRDRRPSLVCAYEDRWMRVTSRKRNRYFYPMFVCDRHVGGVAPRVVGRVAGTRRARGGSGFVRALAEPNDQVRSWRESGRRRRAWSAKRKTSPVVALVCRSEAR
eukprot:1375786-Pleurochrysis_carterae.AAC.1